MKIHRLLSSLQNGLQWIHLAKGTCSLIEDSHWLVDLSSSTIRTLQLICTVNPSRKNNPMGISGVHKLSLACIVCGLLWTYIGTQLRDVLLAICVHPWGRYYNKILDFGYCRLWRQLMWYSLMARSIDVYVVVHNNYN